MINYAESFIWVPALAPKGGVSIFTGRWIPAPMDTYTFRAPSSMQPPPRTVRPVPPPEQVTEQPPEPSTPTGGTLTVNQYLGYEYGRRWDAELAKEEVVQS